MEEESLPISYLLVESGRFLNGERKSKTLSLKLSVRDEGRNAPEIKAHREVWPQGESREGGVGGGNTSITA